MTESRPALTNATSPLPPLGLTPRQRRVVERHLAELRRASQWHGNLPVLLLERCWLRLTCVGIEALLEQLPPNGSRQAPELVRWRELRAAGLSADLAQLQCWQEFGTEACQSALRRYWQSLERGEDGWSHEAYLELLTQYRRRFSGPAPRALPLLVLARAQDGRSPQPHQLHWLVGAIGGSDESMRHTCP